MKTLNELTQYFKDLFQYEEFEDFGPNGLQVEGKKQIRKGVFAVSASLAVIEAAVKWGADFIFVHHGLFWNKDPYVITGTKKEKLALLLKNDISLFGYHLPLDAHPIIGNNWKVATDLGWKNLQKFGKVGVRGEFEKVSREDFQKTLETYYGQSAHVALGGKSHLTSAALTSGGAHRETLAAAMSGVDGYITGSFDEPVWHWAHEEKLNFYALGHASTEKIGPKAVMDQLSKENGLELRFIDENNPF